MKQSTALSQGHDQANEDDDIMPLPTSGVAATGNEKGAVEGWPVAAGTSQTCEIEEEEMHTESQRPLTCRETSNLAFSLLAWACTIANVTLVVGTSNVVHLSIGGDPSMASVPLAAFFLGASLVSFTITPWNFRRWGRKLGFLTGISFGICGTMFGCLAVFLHAPPLLVAGTFAFGAAMGIGFYIRWAAVELVPTFFAEKAVTLVVTGGCIAAFAGPESAAGTKGIFGEEYLYMGVFLMTGVFNVLNSLFVLLVQFPSTIDTSTTSGAHSKSKEERRGRVMSILKSRNFFVPMLISTFCWIIMAVPMSILRVFLKEVGFNGRESLVAIELHFLAMYAPGVITGRLCAYGPRLVATAAIILFLIAFVCLQLSQGSFILWVLGMVFIGIGWNFAFSASTVGSTRSYATHPDCKSAIQAANDGLTFLFAGGVICSASSIYQAGGGGSPGWGAINWVALGFIGFLACILGVDWWIEQQSEAVSQSNLMWSSPSV